MTQNPKPDLTQSLKRGMGVVWAFSLAVMAIVLIAAVCWPEKVWDGEPRPFEYFFTWGAFLLVLNLLCLGGNYLKWRKEVNRGF